MNWVCGNRSFEIYKIDTDNIQESLRETYCEDSHFLSKLYKITKNSKFSSIEHEGYFETFIDGKSAENFIKIKKLKKI